MKTANFSRTFAENIPFKVDNNDWLISIFSFTDFDSGQPAIPANITAPFGKILRIQFDDCGVDDEEPRKFSEQNGLEIAQFINEAKERKVNLWVHCDGGVSRSGAVVECLLLSGWILEEEFAAPRIPSFFVFNVLRKSLGFKFPFES